MKQKVEQFQKLLELLPPPNRCLLSSMIVHMTHIIAKVTSVIPYMPHIITKVMSMIAHVAYIIAKVAFIDGLYRCQGNTSVVVVLRGIIIVMCYDGKECYFWTQL